MIKNPLLDALLLLLTPFRRSSSKYWIRRAEIIKDHLLSGNSKGAVNSADVDRFFDKSAQNPGYLLFLNNAGIAYSEYGQSDKAIEVRKEALALTERICQPSSPEVVDSQLGLAVAYLYAEIPDNALPLLIEAYSVSSLPDFPQRDLALRVHRTLATAYDMLGNTEKAILLAKQALILAESEKSSPEDLTFFQTELALMLRKNGDFSSAIPLLQLAYHLRKDKAPSGNYGVANAAFNLGLALLDICDLEQARKHLDEAYTWRLEHLGSLHAATVRALNAMNSVQDHVCIKK